MSLNLTIFGLCCLALGLSVAAGTSDMRLPGNNRGYTPEQPIAFSHRLHAGEMGIDCQFCHFGARQSRHAGVPPAGVCMNCHKAVTSGLDAQLEERALAEAEQRDELRMVSPELSKLYRALGLSDSGGDDPSRDETPIEWVRVHNLPDFVYFDHRPHVARKIACETCHGPVQGMERMRQESDLSMGWCLDCHRKNAVDPVLQKSPSAPEGRRVDHVSTDCAVCHI